MINRINIMAERIVGGGGMGEGGVFLGCNKFISIYYYSKIMVPSSLGSATSVESCNVYGKALHHLKL
jgi:hypothetical protein